MAKIIILSHCILNQYAKAVGVKNIIPGKGKVEPILELLNKSDVAIIQMPCPEIEYEGVVRSACGQNHYDNAEFRVICDKQARNIKDQVIQYSKAGYQIVGVIGANGSPSCGVARTSLGNGKSASRPGLFIGRLKELLDAEGIKLEYFGVALWTDEEIDQTKKVIADLITR